MKRKTVILCIIVAFLVGASIFINVGFYMGKEYKISLNDTHYKQGFKDALEWKLKVIKENPIGG